MDTENPETTSHQPGCFGILLILVMLVIALLDRKQAEENHNAQDETHRKPGVYEQ